jgi:hypothetical protein
MKLYATTTSERASKGQGGNEYLDIEIQDQNRNTILELKIIPILDIVCISGYATSYKDGKRSETYIKHKIQTNKNCRCAYHDNQGKCTDTPS